MHRSFYPFIIVLAFLGCAGGDDDAGLSARVNCELDPRVDTYTSNMSKASATQTFGVTLVSSEPAPPSRGNNAWQVRVTDAGGEPISNAPLQVELFMPDHGHGTSVEPVITALDNGVYDLVPMNLFMPGVWRITLADPVSGSTDTVQFFFCIAG